jgi:hypothetical protein
MNYRRIDRDLSIANWPEQQKIDSVNFKPGDVLLVCGGFEDRAMTILNKAAATKSNGLTVLNFEYLPSVESNHFQEISELCFNFGWKHIRIEYDRCNPSGVFEVVLKQLPHDLKRIYVDISGMSRLLIVQLIVGLLQHNIVDCEVKVLYTEADFYPPSKSEALTKLSSQISESSEIFSFISTGVYDIAIVPELSSLSLNRAPVRLIAFPSFNPAQLYSAKSIIQPAQTTLIHGVPENPDMHWRKDAICQMNHIDDTKCQSINASTLDYSNCLKSLLSIYGEWSEFNSLVLSPTGSKMQTVAVGVFRSFVKDVQIIYPTPLRFTNPTEHTLGSKQIYELNLTPFIALRVSFSRSDWEQGI